MTTKTKRRRLSPHDVVRMRQWRRKGFAVVDIAKFFGIKPQVASQVVNYRTHKNITEDVLEVPPLLSLQERKARQQATKRIREGR